MDYVVCRKILECFSDDEKCYQILFHSCGVNPDRIIFNTDILNDYSSLNNETIRTWLTFVTMRTSSYKTIECKTSYSANVYVNVCLNTTDKVLFVNEKEDYDSEDIDNIEIFNKHEAHNSLHDNANLIIRGDHASVTTGDGSDIRKSNEE